MPNSPKTAARKAAMNAQRRRLYLLRHVDPTGAIMGARRRAVQANHARRNNAARIIQARVRGMLTRRRMANPTTNIGRRAVMAMFARPNNMRAHGAAIRAAIRYGPEHYVSGRQRPRWSTAEYRCHGALCALQGRTPRGASTRTRSPRRNNNNNNLYR